MFRKVSEFFVDKPIEARVRDLDAFVENGSIKIGILWNICHLAVELNVDTVRVIHRNSPGRLDIEQLEGGIWKLVGELPDDMDFLRGTRFLTNSNQIADSRLPIGTAKLRNPFKPGQYQLDIVRDELSPEDVLEFNCIKC